MATGWAFELHGNRLDEDGLTAGQWERIYLMVNQAGLEHAEGDIRPTHCPTCRNVIAASCLILRAGWAEARALVHVLDLPAGDLLDGIILSSFEADDAAGITPSG